MGESAAPAAPVLILRLGDFERTRLTDSSEVTVPSSEAADALVAIGRPAVPPLLEALQQGHPEVIAVLGRIGDPAAIAPLIAALRDTLWTAGFDAANALSAIGKPAVPHLLRALKDSSRSARMRAAQALQCVADTGAFGPLLRVLTDETEDRDVRFGAIEAIESMGPPVVGRLVDLLEYPSALVRSWVAGALSRIGDTSAADPLMRRLNDPDPKVRQAVAGSLGALGVKRAVGPLLAMLRSRVPGDRVLAALALSEIGDQQAAEPLVAALRDTARGMRSVVSRALCRLESRSVMPQLALMLHDPDPEVRAGAAASLGWPGDSAAARLVIGALNDANGHVRGAAARALTPVRAPDAVPALILALGDPDDSVRMWVARALGSSLVRAPGLPVDSLTVDALVPLLNDPSVIVRWTAVAALAHGDSRVSEPLVRMARDTSWLVRDAARWALTVRRDPRTTDLLTPLLDDPDWQVRYFAVAVLAEVGDQQVVGRLIGCLRDPCEFCRSRAAYGLERITGQLFGENQRRWQRWWRRDRAGKTF